MGFLKGKKKEEAKAAAPVVALRPIEITTRSVSVKDGRPTISVGLNTPGLYSYNVSTNNLDFTIAGARKFADVLLSGVAEVSRLEGAVASLYPNTK